MRLAVTRSRVFWAAYAALGLLYVLPFWLVRHPPAQDLPGHLAMAEVVATRGTSGDPFAGLFTIASFPAPNTLYYYVVGGLAHVMPIEWASKLMLGAAILGLPAALAYARRANGDAATPALAGFALALNFNLIAGFIGFVLALPLALVMVGLARRHAEAPTWRRGAALGAVGLVTFLAHAQLFLFAFGAAGLVTLCSLRRDRLWRRLGLGLAPLAVPLLAVVPWYLSVTGQKGGMAPKYNSFSRNVDLLPIHTFDNLRSSQDMWTGLLVVAGLVALAVLGYATRPSPGPDGVTVPRVSVARIAYALCAAVAAILYFVLPSSIRDQEVINGRMAMVALVFVAAAVPFRWESARLAHRIVLGATLAAVLACGVVYARATARFADEAAGLRATLAAAPPRSRLVGADLPRSKVYRIDVFRHVASYHVVWNQGLVANSFATRSIQPIQVTPAWRALMRRGNEEVLLSGRRRTEPSLRLLHAEGKFYLYAVVR